MARRGYSKRLPSFSSKAARLLSAADLPTPLVLCRVHGLLIRAGLLIDVSFRAEPRESCFSRGFFYFPCHRREARWPMSEQHLDLFRCRREWGEELGAGQ
jgi:hypothetical protein